MSSACTPQSFNLVRNTCVSVVMNRVSVFAKGQVSAHLRYPDSVDVLAIGTDHPHAVRAVASSRPSDNAFIPSATPGSG